VGFRPLPSLEQTRRKQAADPASGPGEHGQPPPEAFRRSSGRPLKSSTTELRNYVRGRRFLSAAVAIGDLDARTDVRISPMSREETLCRLGDLRAHRGAGPGQEVEANVPRGADAEPSYAPAHIGLGYLKERTAAYDEAQEEYDRAVQIAPEDYVANYGAARACCTIYRPAGAGPIPRRLRPRPSSIGCGPSSGKACQQSRLR